MSCYDAYARRGAAVQDHLCPYGEWHQRCAVECAPAALAALPTLYRVDAGR